MTYNVARYCQIFSDFAKYCLILCNSVQNWQILPNISPFSSNGYFSSLYSKLVSIHYLLPVTCFLLLATCFLATVTCYLLLATCYLLHVTCYMLLATCYLLYVTCYMLLSACYLLLSNTCNLIFFHMIIRIFCSCIFDHSNDHAEPVLLGVM